MKKIVKFFVFGGIIFTITIIINILYYVKKLPDNINDINIIEIYDDNNTLINTYYNNQEKSLISLNNIDKNFINYLLKIEDKNFYNHHGFDLLRTIKVFFTNFFSSNKQGASTISQQLSRNLFLTNDKTYERKINELFYSLILEKKYSKDQILEAYLNNIYLGNGIYGYKDACINYFNNDGNSLNNYQILFLLSLIKNPSLINDETKLLDSIENLSNILNINYIKEEFYNHNKKNYNGNYFYYDYLLSYIKKYKIEKPYDLKIYSNINTNLTSYSYNLFSNSNSTAQMSMVAIEPFTGKIKAILGSNNYNNSSYNRAIYSNRQIGSTVKPFNYYNALNYGFNPTTKLLSSKLVINNEVINNFKDQYENDYITMAYALATSDNIYSVKTHMYLGMDKLKILLEKLHFNNVKEDIYLALGNNESSLLTLTNAYNVVASLGKDVKYKFINKIIYNNDIVYESLNDEEQLLNSKLSYLLIELMNNTFDPNLRVNISPTGSSISYNLTKKYAGKSGLTDYDSYFIGFNNKLLIGVWTGYDDNILLSNSNDLVNSKTIWYKSIEFYLKDYDNTWYETPNGVIKKYVNPSGLKTDYKKYLYYLKE